MKFRPLLLTGIFLISLLDSLHSQQDTLRFRDRAPSFSHKRFWGVTSGILAIYGGALGGLSYYWYKDIPRSSFHFFDDGREWMGMDKAGHAYGAYFMSRWITGMYRWTGMKDRAAIFTGGLSSMVLLSSIEILDAFSTKWGFSGWDLLANAGGVVLMMVQEFAWHEQRIVIKLSSLPQNYPDDLKSRADYLFGDSPVELFIKDYNAITVWASANIYSFMKKERRFPKWLNVAVGYGAGGLYGGFENRWCASPQSTAYCDCATDQVDRTDIDRYAQIYLSFDVDFTKIETKKPIVKVLLNLLNMIKVPSPTVEFNTKGKVVFHPLFF